MSKLICSIVIRAYNEEEHIGRLLTGITQQTVQNLETILVDSGSTDGTRQIAGQFPVKIVSIQPEEFTFGYALNRGIQASSADLIVIASAHVYPVYPDWLEQLLAPFVDPKVALVYGKQRGNGSSKFSERQIFARWFPEGSQSHQLHPFCNNANAAVRRSLWEQHPYDETLTGLEDLAWAKWAMDNGHKISYAAKAEIVHVHDETPRGVYNRYRREAMAFKRIFPDEEFSLWDFLRLSVFNIFSDLWHALLEKKIAASFGSIFWFRLMQFWGTYKGYQHAGPITARLRQTFYYPRNLRTDAPQSRDVARIKYQTLNEEEE
ncbi:MAG: putative glycosyltransferase EpsH [Chloroflexi bacterium]|nr:putative glycosyltransferase EpsH [Chloroflexota bacterium]